MTTQKNAENVLKTTKNIRPSFHSCIPANNGYYEGMQVADTYTSSESLCAFGLGIKHLGHTM